MGQVALEQQQLVAHRATDTLFIPESTIQQDEYTYEFCSCKIESKFKYEFISEFQS